MNKEALIAKRNEKAATVNALVAVENRTPEQNAEFDSATAEFESISAEIERLEKAEKINASLSHPQTRAIKPGAAIKVKSPEAKLDSFVAAMPRGAAAVQAAADDLFRESQLADGGYLLPVDKRELVKLIAPPTMVHGLCDFLYTPSNATSVPVDEDPVWSDDLAAAAVAEGAAPTEDKLAFGLADIALAKAMNYVRVTQEMLEDTTGIASYVTTKLGEKLAWNLHAKAITAFLASPAKKTLVKTGGAAAGSAPDLANVQAMWVSMLAPMRSRAVWLANPVLETALQNFVIGQVPVYVPAGGLSGSPYATLFGRPIMFIEGLPAKGTEGDLTLVDPGSFWCVMKTQGPRVEASIHAEFKNDIVVYKGAVRATCASKNTKLITRKDGTTAGNVITIATRS